MGRVSYTEKDAHYIGKVVLSCNQLGIGSNSVLLSNLEQPTVCENKGY